jgi:hypothetical protein
MSCWFNCYRQISPVSEGGWRLQALPGLTMAGLATRIGNDAGHPATQLGERVRTVASPDVAGG